MDPHDESEGSQEKQERPRGQIIFDNIFLWFILSLAFSLLLYNGWGLLELLLVPPAP
jgi:hypothetical protein